MPAEANPASRSAEQAKSSPGSAGTVQAISIRKPGSYEHLELVERPLPAVGPGEIGVKVRAIGVNYADCVVRMGLYRSAKEFVGWPITPGFEFSGWVDRIGDGVEGFELGQRVVGVMLFGAYASYVVVPQAQLFPLPKGWSLEQGGSYLVAYLTAWYALRELSRLRPRMKVLVHSAAGGVGSVATQIANAAGCEVIGVVGSRHKVAVAKAQGAHAVIDRSTQELWESARELAPRGYDVILEPNGGRALKQGYDHLRPTGRVIVYGFIGLMSRGKKRPNPFKLAYGYLTTPRLNPFEMTTDNKGVLAFNLSYLGERMDLLAEAMDELYTGIEKGQLRPLAVTTFPLAEAAQAHRAIESGTTVGKLALVTDATGP